MDAIEFSKELKAARKQAGINQSELAARIGVGRDFIVRMERGENVGVHAALMALSALGASLSINRKNVAQARVVPGSFDQYYQKRFGRVLQAGRKSRQGMGIAKPEDKHRIKIVNLAQAVKL